MYQDPKPITKEFKIEIISEPSGAKIEVDNNYVGKTPCTITITRRYVWQSWNNEYGIDQLTRQIEVVANPVFEGGSLQRKYIPSSVSEVPKKIYFNMYLSRRDPTYNFNIN